MKKKNVQSFYDETVRLLWKSFFSTSLLGYQLKSGGHKGMESFL